VVTRLESGAQASHPLGWKGRLGSRQELSNGLEERAQVASTPLGGRPPQACS